MHHFGQAADVFLALVPEKLGVASVTGIAGPKERGVGTEPLRTPYLGFSQDVPCQVLFAHMPQPRMVSGIGTLCFTCRT